jgi:hypothetical protein
MEEQRSRRKRGLLRSELRTAQSHRCGDDPGTEASGRPENQAPTRVEAGWEARAGGRYKT